MSGSAPRVEDPARCAPTELHIHPVMPPPQVVSVGPHVPRAAAVPEGVRGAVVCSGDVCIIRRSFIRQMLDDPRMLSSRPWRRSTGPDGRIELRVRGVYPGSVADVIGLREGDAIIAIDGRPLPSAHSPTQLGATLEQREGFTLTVRRAGQPQTLRYWFIDDGPSS